VVARHLKMGPTLSMDESVKPAIRGTLRPKKSVLSAVSLKGILVVIQNYLTIIQYALDALKVILCKPAPYVVDTESL